MWWTYVSQAVMSIESTDKRLADFPFPSITICSQNKISKKKMSRILANPRYSQHFTKEQIMTLTLTMINALESINYADELKTISKIASASNISFKEILNVTSEVIICHLMWSFFCNRKKERKKLKKYSFDSRKAVATQPFLCIH